MLLALGVLAPTAAAVPNDPAAPIEVGGAGAPPPTNATANVTGSSSTPPVDQGASPKKKASAEKEKKLPWRGTTLGWSNRATAQTVGLGDDYQSSNPYAEWFFSLRPRYYLWEGDGDSLSLRLTLNAYTELTNSDTTTKEHEFLIDDSTIALVPSFTLWKDGDYKTVLSLTAPRVTLPTSKASRSSGIYAEVGVRASITQTVPVSGGDADFFRTANFGARAGYAYLFSKGNVPLDADLDQLRRNVDGVTVSNDQLRGAALAQHRASGHVFGGLDIYKDVVSLESEIGMDWFWKFPLAEAEVTLETGPAEVESQDSTRLQRSLFFNVGLSINAIEDILTLGVGYESFPTQLGPGGTRRSIFYSPDALLYFALDLSLDGLYLEATGQKAPKEVAGARSEAAGAL
jgi:hypothetical protein